MSPDVTFSRSILAPLTRFGRRIRLYALLQGLAAACALVALALAFQFATDFLLRLERLPRGVLLALVAAVAVHSIWRYVVQPLRIVMNPERLALTIEQYTPALRDRLVSAVQFATASGAPAGVRPADESRSMMQAVVSQAARDFEAIRPATLLQSRRTQRCTLLLVVLIGGAFGLVQQRPDLVGVYLARNLLMADAPWPSNRQVILEGAQKGAVRRPRGDDLALTVSVQGDVPRDMQLQFRLPDGTQGERPMSRLGQERFRSDFGPLNESMEVRFLSARWGTDEATDWYSVEAVDRPQVRRAAVRISPPAYTRQPPYAFPAGQVGGDVPAGSEVTFEVELNKPVKRARLKSANQDLGAAEDLGDLKWKASVRPQRSASFAFDLLDDLGLEDVRPVTFSLRLLADRTPAVRLKLPGLGDMILPEAVLPLELEFEDNWGLASAEFEYQIDRPAASTQPAPAMETVPGFEPYQTRFTHRRDWPVAGLGLQAQDRLVLSALARDFKDFGEPNIGRSASHALRVVTRDELLAELARRENEWRQEFEAIVSAQEELRARLLTIPDESEPRSRSIRYDREERAQRQYAARVRKVQTQFQQILSEMEINRIATPQIRRRLDDGIIAPLSDLTADAMPAAADLIARLSRDPDDPAGEGLEPMESGIVKVMNTVLANMLKFEGFNEATALLRDILKLQGELNRDTQAELERQIERLFGPEE